MSTMKTITTADAAARALEAERVNLGRSYRGVKVTGAKPEIVTGEDGKRVTVGTWVTATVTIYVSGEESRRFAGSE